jgi:hypothetical protein
MLADDLLATVLVDPGQLKPRALPDDRNVRISVETEGLRRLDGVCVSHPMSPSAR